VQFEWLFCTSYLGLYDEPIEVAVRVMLHVLQERTDADGVQDPAERPGLLNRLLALRSSGDFDSACVIAAVETGPTGRVFRTPPFEALFSGEKVLYLCTFLQFEKQLRTEFREGENPQALPGVSQLPLQTPKNAGYGTKPLDKASFEREFGAGATGGDNKALPERSREDTKEGGRGGETVVPWDRAFEMLVIGNHKLGHSNVLWASLIADSEHGPQFAVELLDALAQMERSPALFKMTSHAYVIIEHQLRASPEWAAAAERGGLCWAMAGGVWERVLEDMEGGESEASEGVGNLLRDGCSLLVAFFECIVRTACFKNVPERIGGGVPELGKDPLRKVWLAQHLCPDLLKVYGAYGKSSDGLAPENGIPSPRGGDFYEGPRRGPRRDVRAKARQGLMLAQWLWAETGRGEWFPGSDKLLLRHDAAAEGDSEVRAVAGLWVIGSVFVLLCIKTSSKHGQQRIWQ
jgi:hypothetical protein